jgi:hypothetical protein
MKNTTTREGGDRMKNTTTREGGDRIRNTTTREGPLTGRETRRSRRSDTSATCKINHVKLIM